MAYSSSKRSTSEYVMDGHYGFLKKGGGQFKSGFLGDSAPADIEKAIRDLATRYG